MKKNAVEQTNDTQRLKRAFVAIEKLQSKLKALEYARTEPIAIIGIGCRFPGGANNPDAYWQLLRDGVDAISEVPADRWDVEAYYDQDWTKQGKINTRDSGFLNTKVYEFDPPFFGIAPREALQLDPQQRLLLEVAWEALEYANIVPDRLFSSSTGVFMGISTVDYAVRQLGMQEPAKIGAYVGTGALLSPAAGRLSYVLGLTGPSTIVDTACSSSLLAVHFGCQSLRNKESDLVLSGGVNLILAPELSSYFSTAGMLSPDGRCKTFDAAANGYVRAEGCGVMVLKRLSDALADGDNILALIRGSALNQDGPSGGLTVPSGPSQEQVIKQALARAGLEPNQVDYIEAHGTGTALGDPIEVGALSAVFGKDRPQDRPLLIGSAKTNVGHMEAAAGMAGLIKLVLALQHEEIPPHLHFKQPSPRIPWEEFPVKVPTERTRWLPSADKRRIAGISSFGFSGTNAHVILEEAPKSPNKEQKSADNRPVHLLTLSAKSEAALKELAGRYEKSLSDSVANPVQHKERDLGDVCFTANTCRSHFQHRLSVVAGSSAQMREKLAAFIAGTETGGIFAGKEGTQFRIAFLFTGQGSQYVGMGRTLYDTNATFRQSIVRCDEILRPWLKKPLLEVLYNNSRADNALLNETVYTQPALFALEYALAQLWKSWGIEPSVVMGHSVGEYVAACVAGVFSLEDGLKLIAERARLMYNLPREGEMVTVFASETSVATAIKPYTQQVSIAAFNGPESLVISGQREAINAIVSTFEADGIKTKPLKVSHAFHSPLIEPMLSDFERVAKEITFSPPQIDLISNLTGELATAEITTPEYWCRHIRQPVKFAASMETLYQQGDEVLFVEIGPRPALLGLCRQCLPENAGVWLPSLRYGQEDWQQILQSLGELYVRGAPVNWAGFDQDYQRQRVRLPTYPFQRKRYCIEIPNARRGFLPHDAKLHPLINKKIQSPLLKETLFESYFHTDELPLLADHLVYDKVVVSGASHVSLILGATEITFGTKGCVLEEIFFQHALLVPDEGCTVQLAITQNDDAGEASFNLISFGTNTEAWTTHVTGKILSNQLPTTNEPLHVTSFQAAWDRCEQTVTAAEFYQTQLERHIYLGPRYQWVESILRGKGEAVCQINLPVDMTDAGEYQLPPGLIDACFGLLAVAVEMVVPDTFIPFSIEKIYFLKRPSDFQLQAHVQLRPESDDNRLVGDIRLFEKTSGQVIAEFMGFEGRKATRNALLAVTQESLQEWLYEVEWLPQARFGLPTDYLPTPTEISTEIKSYVANAVAHISFYETFKPQLDALSVQFILNAFQHMGWTWKLNQSVSTGGVISQLGVVRQHQRLLGRLLEMLAEEQIIIPIPTQSNPPGKETALSQDGTGWKVVSVPDIKYPQVLMETLLAQYPASSAELTLLGRCGAQLAEVLKGECDPIPLLFPEGDLTTLTQFYQDSPGQLVMNTIAQKVVLSALARLPQGRGVRLLEIGAGTGSTTAHILPHLPAHRTEYVFTDVSSLFTTKAQEKFIDYPFVRYQVLDIEQAPALQGFGEHEYDMIVAANVLHATKDLGETLQHIHNLLAPGGMLVLMEGTARQRWLDLTFGLLEGWWQFTDQHLRPSYPLLSAEQWQTLLQEKGFTQTVSISPDMECKALALHQTVIVAQTLSPLSQRAASGDLLWLILADSQGIGQQLATVIRGNGEDCTLVFSGKAYEQIDEQSFKIDSNRPEDYQQILETVRANQRSLRGVVHCWGLDTVEAAESLTVENLKQAQLDGCGNTLHLVQALVKADFSEPPALFIVTQGATPVAIQAPISNYPLPITDYQLPITTLTQSALWGMGKVIALEHPELNCVRVDLEPDTKADKADKAQALFEEIWSPTKEDQIAFRDNARYVPRLARYRQPESPLQKETDQLHSPNSPFNGGLFRADSTYLITGGLGGLGLLIAQWMVEKYGVKHLVLVGRSAAKPAVSNQLKALEEAGASVVVAQADVSQSEQIAQVLADIEPSQPPLRGIIHAAGVLDDGVLTSQNWARFEKVLAPKVFAAWNLHTLTKHLSLDFFVLFSSAASLLGSQAQANHAAANTFLDALAYYRQAQGLAGLSINWGAWSEIGAAAKRKAGERMEMKGMGTIAPQQGLQILEQLFSQSATQVGVVPINWSQFILTPWAASPFFSHFKQAKASTVSKQTVDFIEQLKSVPAKERRTHLIAYIQSQVANILGLDASQPIEAQQGFFDLGMDSLTAVELRNRLQTSLGCSLPSTLLFTYPTIMDLVEYLATEVLAFSDDAINDVEEQTTTLDENKSQDDKEFAYLEELSHEDIEALINQELD